MARDVTAAEPDDEEDHNMFVAIGSMEPAQLILVGVTAVVNLISGGISVAARSVVEPRMSVVGVPPSWLVFPIGTLKIAGGLGLLAGLWLPFIGVAAAIGLVLFYVCAVYTHLVARHYAMPFGLSFVFLALAVATLSVPMATGNVSGCH